MKQTFKIRTTSSPDDRRWTTIQADPQIPEDAALIAALIKSGRVIQDAPATPDAKPQQ